MPETTLQHALPFSAGVVLVFAYRMLVPGYLACVALRLRRHRFLLSIGISYALLSGTLISCELLRTPVSWVNRLADTEVLFLVAAAWLRTANGRADRLKRAWRRAARRDRWRFVAPLALTVSIVTYVRWAGPYTEIPADVWGHLQYMQAQSARLGSGHFDGMSCPGIIPVAAAPGWLNLFVCIQKSYQWHLVAALLCRAAGTEIMDAVATLTAANTVVFALGLYSLGLRLVSRLRLAAALKIAVASGGAVFAALHMGVSVFAYVRYYALAPGILNFVLYMASIAILLDLLEQRRGVRYAYLFPPLLLTMAFIHAQELLFFFFMALGLLWWGAVSLLQSGRWRAPGGRVQLIVAFAATALYAALGVTAMIRNSPIAVGVHTMFVEELIPFVRGLVVARPNAGFYLAATHWGLLVWVLFLVYLPRRWKTPYVSAGMALPLVTLFNPLSLAILALLRVPETLLYRFVYPVPLHLVGAVLAAHAVVTLRGWLGTVSVLPPLRKAQHRRLGLDPSAAPSLPAALHACLVLLGLIVFLFPVQRGFIEAPFSRLSTLRPVPPANGAALWWDLIEFLGPHAGSAVATDAVTGHVINGATQAVAPGDRFTSSAFDPWLRPSVSPREPETIFDALDPARNWLLVINLRDGGLSEVGRQSGHWPSDVLAVSRLYSEAALAFVDSRPGRFRLIWEHDRIRVYQVHPRRRSGNPR